MRIAAYGWDHPGWEGGFYPADLPEEWRLAYYANAFPAVVVPAPLVMGASGRELAHWAGETAPSFRFLVELPLEAGGQAAARCTGLGERLGGFLVPPGAPWGVTGLPAAVPAWWLGAAEEAAALGLRPCWRPDRPWPGAAAAGLGWCEPAPDLAAPELGTLLRGFAAAAGAGEGVLVVAGSPPPAGVLGQLRRLAELMG